MFPVREGGPGESEYHEHLVILRGRILSFIRRRLAPHEADFAQAEDLAQSCIVALWEGYPDKRELGEMTAILVGIARRKIAQFRRELGRTEAVESEIPAPTADVLERLAARESMDRVIRAMLALPVRCRELLRLKLIEEKSYADIRMALGISGNIYEMMRRCHKSLLRLTGGGEA